MISVILPTRNEPLINQLIREIHAVLRRQRHEVIVIDLSDQPPAVRRARLYRQKTKGLGNAVVEGVEKARGNLIVVMDADFSHDPSDIPRLLEKLQAGCDFVMGSRYCPGGRTEDSKRRYGIFPNAAISKVYCSLASFLLRLDMRDPMNGFAAARREVYEAVTLNPRGYKVHMETAFKAKRQGFTIGEAPTTFRKRRAGKSNTGMQEAIRTLRFIVELWLGRR